MAVWRISSMLVMESGPWEIFSRLREWAKIEYDDAGNVTDNGRLGALTCLQCVSIWVGALFFITFLLVGEGWTVIVALPFTFSMGAIIWDALVG
jgi:hypothetical protein